MTPEEYIKAYTRGCSNELIGGGYHEWLTPENTLAAVELAREEMMAKAIRGRVSVNVKSNYHSLIYGCWDMDNALKNCNDGDKVKIIIIKE
jgi:hypothetical protein